MNQTAVSSKDWSNKRDFEGNKGPTPFNQKADFGDRKLISLFISSQVPKGIDVAFRVFGPKDEKRLRSILNRWKDRGYFGNISISDEEKGYASKSTVTLQVS